MSKKKEFVAPTFEEFEEFCALKGYRNIARTVYDGYEVADWHDSKGSPIRNWKQKLLHVWFKDHNKDKVQLPIKTSSRPTSNNQW